MKGAWWLLIFATLAVVGCTTIPSVPMASSEMDASAKTFSPPAGLANVYIYRTEQGIFGPASFQVVVDGKVVGSIVGKTFFLVTVEAGNHTIGVSSNENSARAKFDVVAGKNYFFDVEATMGMASARATIAQVTSEDEGRTAVQGAKLAEGLED